MYAMLGCIFVASKLPSVNIKSVTIFSSIYLVVGSVQPLGQIPIFQFCHIVIA